MTTDGYDVPCLKLWIVRNSDTCCPDGMIGEFISGTFNIISQILEVIFKGVVPNSMSIIPDRVSIMNFSCFGTLPQVSKK